jgi:hypothetical protein
MARVEVFGGRLCGTPFMWTEFLCPRLEPPAAMGRRVGAVGPGSHSWSGQRCSRCCPAGRSRGGSASEALCHAATAAGCLPARGAYPAVSAYPPTASNARPGRVGCAPARNRPTVPSVEFDGSANQAYRCTYGRPCSMAVDAVTKAACCFGVG